MKRVDPRHLSLFTYKAFAASRVLVLVLWALFVFSGESLAQGFKLVHPGVEYAHVDHKIGSDPVKINVLRLDRLKVKLDVVHAGNAAIGLETTSSIAKRRGAVAAINSGFFRLDKSPFAGDAAGVLMIDRALLSESYADRTAVFISDRPSTNMGFGRIRTQLNIEAGGRSVPVNGINRERKADEVVVYTDAFGPGTMTAGGGMEIAVVKGKVTAVRPAAGNSFVPKGGFVISASGAAAVQFSSLKPGDPAVLYSAQLLLSDQGNFPLDMVDDIVAGVPQLIKAGRVDITWQQEKSSKAFAETRHPRTAVAKLKDGKFLMVTVDGRQPGVSVGMTLQELAEYLLSLGAVEAVNLDGGGSTTMYLDGKVANTPSDKEGERKVGDAIVVTLKK